VKITVIICTYNRSQTLACALESTAVLRLPESDEWEVLIVDNNSSDKTRDVVEDFCRRYPGRFRYLFEPEQGKSYALNSGIRESQSEILAFTDDDAMVEPDWLSNLTGALREMEWVGAGGRIIPVWARPLPGWLSTDDPHTMGPFVAFDLGETAGPLMRPPYGANMAFRKEAFTKYGNFRTDLGRFGANLQGREDIEFANRLLAASERLRYEPGAVVRHPAPESRMTKKYVLKWWFQYARLEIAESGPPEAKYRIAGVPLCLFRRMVRWGLQWMVSVSAPARFACLRNMWYLAGSVVACYDWRHRSGVPAAEGEGFSGTNPERHVPEVGPQR
jgi:glucosyl-dolichyl phosphate glucuronosyltransferase